MISKRIKYIASLVTFSDKVLDIGTDHALLPIYLIKNGVTDTADGCDISSNVLINAKSNLIKYNLDKKINLFCSDGTKQVNTSKYNTFIITGMGFYTVKDILDNSRLDNINRLIIQSNNNHEDLRRYLNLIGYKIIKDHYIMDKNKPYLIVDAIKGNQKLSDQEYICGLLSKDNKWYYEYILNKYKKILDGIPNDENNDIKQKIGYYNNYMDAIKRIED